MFINPGQTVHEIHHDYKGNLRFMKYVRRILVIFALLTAGQWAKAQVDFTTALQPIPRVSKFTDPGYLVWCGSLIRGDDGKYYLFYSRWPSIEGFKGWVTHCEIALAVSDHLTGPFKPLKVILPPREKGYWDSDVTHNPNIQKFDGKYYLYYLIQSL